MANGLGFRLRRRNSIRSSWSIPRDSSDDDRRSNHGCAHHGIWRWFTSTTRWYLRAFRYRTNLGYLVAILVGTAVAAIAVIALKQFWPNKAIQEAAAQDAREKSALKTA